MKNRMKIENEKRGRINWEWEEDKNKRKMVNGRKT